MTTTAPYLKLPLMVGPQWLSRSGLRGSLGGDKGCQGHSKCSNKAASPSHSQLIASVPN